MKKVNKRTPPTERQSKMLEVIKNYTAKRGFPPTVRDIGKAMKITSPNGVMCHLKALEKRGLLRRARANGRALSRGFTVVK